MKRLRDADAPVDYVKDHFGRRRSHPSGVTFEDVHSA